MIRAATVTAALALAFGFAQGVSAAEDEAGSSYGRDLISVVTNGRHAVPATANCIVWINAEGLGVGPKQLGGQHGLAMNINPKPLTGESVVQPTGFAAGLASLRAENPKAPAWLFRALEKSRAGIEAGCAEDHATPVKVRALSRADMSS